MPRRYWGILIVYIIAQLLPGIILVNIHYPESPTIDDMVYWTLGSMAIATLWILYLLRKDMAEVNMRSGPTTGEIVKWSIIGVFLAYAVQIVANMINIYVLGIDGGSENTQSIMEIIDANIWFIILPIVFAPILEEIIFRKIIFGELYKRTNFIIAGIISALIFAAVHMDFTFILTYTAMGFAFAYLYVKTKRIIVPIIAHMAMNAIVVLIQMNVDIDELERQLEEFENAMMIFFGG
ncbi:CPBP family intramembrane glutamic endopeptidase [Alkalibacillus haloalkaliphilus]|uniref:CPBP family intramembrane glutamic endopeptidase n=1 Tax=Alkalibacillus haloalkaliphilus TaxID=94136 RepID=UPI002936237F|nr:type II CAAX endopeptidase family protein [Alkalibacillus haloalkaliphilus]MDV2581641.1 type II CAAX endopeptidase family protein [Alkalibacillus haloalkaliphilus]